MAIAAIHTIPVLIPFDVDGPKQEFLGQPRSHIEALYLKVETSDGYTGWGEAFGFNLWPVIRKAMDDFIAPFIIGRDENDIDALMTELRRRFHVFGRTGPVNYALSGLDIALWDIAGKKAGKPLAELFGGARRDSLPAYASLMKYGEADALARNCAHAKDLGYSAVKIHESTVRLAQIARDSLGAGPGLMVDTNCAWTLEQACSYLPALQAMNLLWLEEPTWPPENLDNFRVLRERADIPLAAGENAATPWELAAMSRSGLLDVVQPSVIKIGGISEMRAAYQALTPLSKTQGSARAQPIAHSPYFGPGLFATLQLAAALEQESPLEKLFCTFEAHPYGDAIEVVNGRLRVPTGPGLGIDPDPQILQAFSVTQP
ncbi:MAG TPA: mandelate racemase/muconate lactonizing enzyme family protein [Bordetella sp.]